MPDTEELEETQGLAQFNRLLPEAKTIPDRDVKTFRIDPVLALQNVADGVASLAEVGEERLRAELPSFDFAKLQRISDLALAVGYSVRRAENMVGPGKVALLKEGTALRGVLLQTAFAFAAADLMSEAKVKKIAHGTGAIDVAKDCVELAALFKEHADAIRGKSPVPAAEVKRAGEVGAELLAILRPKGSTRSIKPQEMKDAAEERDRLGTMLMADYDQLRRAAGWLWGRDADAKVPPLGSRAVKRRKPKTE